MKQNVNNQDLFLEAYDAHADAIFRYCYFRVFDRERAKELAQECFMRTWESITEGKEIKNIRAFFYRVANNLVIDSIRKRKESSLEAMEVDLPMPEHAFSSPEIATEAKIALTHVERLEESEKNVVKMRYLDGLGPKEIAEVLGESENIISVRLHRAIKKLRSELIRV